MTSSAPTLHRALRLYGQWRADEFSMHTWAGEAPGLLAFVDFCADAGVERFDQLNDDLVDDWWQYAKARLEESTAVTRVSQLRSFLGWAIKKRYLVDDPTLFIRAARPAPELRERLSARELLQIIGDADFRQHRLILALCANLALRQSEIKTLRIRDVRLDDRTILVHVHKTKQTPPDPMPITAELDAELRSWLAHYRQQVPGLTADSHLVPAQHVGIQGVTYHPDRSIGEPEDVVKRALTKLGWTRDEIRGEGIHTIRRSVARIFFDGVLEDEGDGKFDEALLGCMRLLHHDRAETTLRYIGVDRQTLARDRYMQGRSFLPRLAGAPKLAIAL